MTTWTGGLARALAAGAALSLTLVGCRPPAPTGPPSKDFETEATQMQAASPDQRPWFCNGVGKGTPPGGHGNGNHVHPYYEGKTKGPLSWTDCVGLARQLDQTMNGVKGLETKGKAERAGSRQIAQYVPGLGTHHSNPRAGFTAGFDPAKPGVLIFGGDTPDAPLVGVAFVGGGATPPEGYIGGNDWWHLHTQTCRGLDPRQFPDPGDLTPEQCRAAGGVFQNIAPRPDGSPGGVLLLHMWMIKPYEYRPDLFISGHPCMADQAAAPQSDPCWQTAHRDPSEIPPTTTPDDHGTHGH